MALSTELEAEIEQMISAVKKGKYRRAGMGINDFIDVLSKLLAQMSKDLPSLINAGFKSANAALYQGYFEMLSLIVGERRGVSPDAEQKRAYFDKQMKNAEFDKKRLMVVGGYIANNCDDKSARRNYNEIAKGTGIIDTLCDNIALIAGIRKYPELASQIKPGGVVIDEKYCVEVSERALELLALKGFVIEKGVPENVMVDRKNRLITLCMAAISDIKVFAKAAYFDDLTYYNDNYSSLFRQQSDSSDDVDDTDDTDDEKDEDQPTMEAAAVK